MRKIAHKILLFCVIFTLLFILGNSLMPGDVSSRESGWVMRHLTPLLDYLQSGRLQLALVRLAEGLPRRLAAALYRMEELWGERVLSRGSHYLVRKMAHFSEYMLLGFWLGLFFTQENGHSRFFLSELLCATVAVCDELLQWLPGGRSPQIADVCVDVSGATLGLLVALTLLAALRFALRSSGPISESS